MTILDIQESLKIAWQGMLAVFIGITVIYLLILILISLQRKHKEK